MKTTIHESLESLNKYIEHRKRKDIEIQHYANVVGKNIDMNGVTTFQIVDRFLVIED